jgi:hypothetical protein
MNRLILILSLLGVGIGLCIFSGFNINRVEEKLSNNVLIPTMNGRYSIENFNADRSLYCCIGLAGMLSTLVGLGIIFLIVCPRGSGSSHSGEVQIAGKNEYGQSVKVWIKVK